MKERKIPAFCSRRRTELEKNEKIRKFLLTFVKMSVILIFVVGKEIRNIN